MFALPWFLTWFGHSLNQYRDVVRLYDFFLAKDPMMPIYVAAALVVSRRKEVFAEGCDMASIHCLLSNIPDDVNFEEILVDALKYFDKYPPSKLEKDVKKRIQNEYVSVRRKSLFTKVMSVFKYVLSFAFVFQMFMLYSFIKKKPKTS